MAVATAEMFTYQAISYESTKVNGLPRDVIEVTQQAQSGRTVHQKIEVFNPGVSDEGIVFIPGLFSIEAPHCSSGKSRNFNGLLEAFPGRQIVLAHWPNELIAPMFLANIADSLTESEISTVSYRGICAGAAMTMGLVALNEQRGREVSVRGISFLVPAITTAELQIGAQVMRQIALAGQHPLLSSIIDQQKLRESLLGRTTGLPTRPYHPGDVDSSIPVQVIKTPGRTDNVVNTDRSLAVLQELFDRVELIQLEGKPFFQLKSKAPYICNPGGSHALRRPEVRIMQDEVIRFLQSPETYSAPEA